MFNCQEVKVVTPFLLLLSNFYGWLFVLWSLSIMLIAYKSFQICFKFVQVKSIGVGPLGYFMNGFRLENCYFKNTVDSAGIKS